VQQPCQGSRLSDELISLMIPHPLLLPLEKDHVRRPFVLDQMNWAAMEYLINRRHTPALDLADGELAGVSPGVSIMCLRRTSD
jgi:hypothetical protein